MRESIPLGRIAGIRVGANWSVLAILGIITFLLATDVFPTRAPGFPWTAYLGAALVTSLVFLLSLLAHEISHAIVAQRNGVAVEGITLWLFGGVARLEDEADNPAADLRIAGVGPLVSAILCGLFYGGLRLAATTTDVGLLTASLFWLAFINGALALFNLVPGAPLDGGRLLRSALWRRSGDRYRASIAAARAGRVFGMVLIGLGIVEVVFIGLLGLWLALVGWFLINAAGAEQRHARHQQRFTGIEINHVMSPQPFTAPAELTVERFIEQYHVKYRFSTFPLTGLGGRFAGLVTLDPIRAVPGEDRARTRLDDIALGPNDVPTARPQDPLNMVLSKRSAGARGRIVVLDDDQQVVGIVTPTDIARAAQTGGLTGF